VIAEGERIVRTTNFVRDDDIAWSGPSAAASRK
jgi:hypothetical protein